MSRCFLCVPFITLPLLLCWNVDAFQHIPLVSRGRLNWVHRHRHSCVCAQQQATISTSSLLSSSSDQEIAPSPTSDGSAMIMKSLPDVLNEQKDANDDMVRTICAAATACVEISQELARLPITARTRTATTAATKINVQGEEQKPMDVIANSLFIQNVRPNVAFMASEEEEDVIRGGRGGSHLEIAFDPLDGSSNLDVSVPTGTIFGISSSSPSSTKESRPFSSFGRRSLCAAGYAVYSSSVELVISLGTSGSGSGSLSAHGFTLDPSKVQKLLDKRNDGDYDQDKDEDEDGPNITMGEYQIQAAKCFVLTRPNMQCPERGAYYSLNDGREPDWPEGLRRWIHDAKRGQTPSGTVYSSRYICSLCADVHRTLIKGGWAGNPRPFLRLLFEAAPLAHIVEACGGRGSNGVMDLLDIEPEGLHDRTCVFLGSRCDINELETYGDVQQNAKMYKT